MATIDLRALKKAIGPAIKKMNESLGAPAPKVAASHEQILAVAGMVTYEFNKQFQQSMLREVRTFFSGKHPSRCLDAADGPFKKLGEGVQGTVWLTKDRKRAFKIGYIGLRDDHGISRKFEETRTEFAITEAAAGLGIGPKVIDTYFCCNDTHDHCYYVLGMEFVPGKSLWEWSKKASAASKEEMRQKLLKLVRRLNDAGIEHADLHANNVIVSEQTGEPVIIDYGMASWAKAERLKDKLSINRFFSDTTTLADAAYYVARILISDGIVKFSWRGGKGMPGSSKPASKGTSGTRGTSARPLTPGSSARSVTRMTSARPLTPGSSASSARPLTPMTPRQSKSRSSTSKNSNKLIIYGLEGLTVAKKPASKRIR